MNTNASPTPSTLHPPAIEFDGISRRFGSVAALDSVSFRIERGETVALLGPNGAGKSTAISILLGLVAPSDGRAQVLGQSIEDAIRSGRVGAMLQDAALPVGARVGELVDLVRATYPAPLRRDSLLERAALEHLADRRVDTLSGGEAQRVRFALAIAGNPDLVFLDEPTVAMDVDARRGFWTDLRRAAADGRTILFATHYLDEADQVADRIVVLDRGRVVADGSPSALKAGVRERIVRFTLQASDAAAGLHALRGVTAVERHGEQVSLASLDADATVRDLVATRIDFRHLEVAGASLDAAFLALTGAGARAA